MVHIGIWKVHKVLLPKYKFIFVTADSSHTLISESVGWSWVTQWNEPSMTDTLSTEKAGTNPKENETVCELGFRIFIETFTQTVFDDASELRHNSWLLLIK